MRNLSSNELKLIVKSRGVKGYKNKSKDELAKILSKPESNISSLKLRIKDIREEFNELRDRFLKPKIKEIEGSLYERGLLNRAPTSTQLNPPPPSSFQPPSSPIHLHPAHFSLHPALCNTFNVIRTKISHVIKQSPQI